jgi:hypothetical protein
MIVGEVDHSVMQAMWMSTPEFEPRWDQSVATPMWRPVRNLTVGMGGIHVRTTSFERGATFNRA